MSPMSILDCTSSAHGVTDPTPGWGRGAAVNRSHPKVASRKQSGARKHRLAFIKGRPGILFSYREHFGGANSRRVPEIFDEPCNSGVRFESASSMGRGGRGGRGGALD